MSCVRCGKILCEAHVAALRECPFCKDKPFRAQVERGVRQLLDEVPYPCQFCASAIPRGSLDVHEANCAKRPRRCGVTGCVFVSVEPADALRHLIDAHGPVVWENYTQATAAGMKLSSEIFCRLWAAKAQPGTKYCIALCTAKSR